MQRSDVYVTVGLDKKGNVVEVQVNGRTIESRRGTIGPIGQGGTVPGCEKVLEVLVHELLTCAGKGPGKPPEGGATEDAPPYPPPGSDPCCYRDPRTGQVWCWC